MTLHDGVLAAEQARVLSLRAAVDAALDAILPSQGLPSHRIHAAMRHAVLSPGKRIRPLLALLSAELLGCTPQAVMPAACALELVHAASLVLDDLPCMDDSDSRRGQPSVHSAFGQDVAVLTGVALLNEAFGVLARLADISPSTKVEMVSLLAGTVGTNGLIAGQDGDLRHARGMADGNLSDVHHQKTGVLFMAAVEMGALAAGADETNRRALRICARELGLAFQALDDLEDEDDLQRPLGAANMLSVLGRDGVVHEVLSRLRRAKEALAEAGPHLRPMGTYIDLLFPRLRA